MAGARHKNNGQDSRVWDDFDHFEDVGLQSQQDVGVGLDAASHGDC